MRWKLLTRCFSKACIKRACTWKRLNARLFCRKAAGPFGSATFVTASLGEHTRSFALMSGLLQGLEDAREVIGLRRLHRRKLLVGHKLLLPQQLAERQDIPVVEIRSAWRAQRTGIAQQRLGVGADCLLEGITLDVRNLGPVKGLGPEQSAGAGVGHHRVVELPVLVAYRRRLRSRVVEEHFACRFVRRAL